MLVTVARSGLGWGAVEQAGDIVGQTETIVNPAPKLEHRPFGDQFELRLDAKGRVILPPVFRPAFLAGGRLIGYEGDCLALWTEQSFQFFDERMFTKRDSMLSGKGPRRALWTSAAYVVPDSQGRFVIPERLRLEVALTVDVTLVGNIDHLEIWPSDAWKAAWRDGQEMLAMEIATDDGPRPDQLR